MRALAMLAMFAPVVAQADPKLPTTTREVFAAGMSIEDSAIVEVQDFSLKNAGPYVRAVVGRFKSGEHVIGGAVLTWCDAKLCWLSHAWLGPGKVETLGLVDLGGAPAAFPNHAKMNHEHELELDAKPAWPALLVRATQREQTTSSSRYGGTVSGEKRHVELFVLSLSPSDTKSPTVLRETVDEHSPTGAGRSVTFAVGKTGHLVATEQRDLENISRCVQPKPTTAHYKLDEHRRFRRGMDLEHSGC